MESKTYTQEEIQKNIETLTSKMESFKIDRREITQNINSLKKQIDVWLNLDKSQYKMFED